jgi:hypothetical protein
MLISSDGEADAEEEICSEQHPVALEPHGYRWYRIHGERS